MKFKEFKIVEHFKYWAGGSVAVIILGIVFMFTRGFNLGIDFTGGTMLQIDLGKTVSVAEIQEVIKPYNLDGEILHIGEKKQEVMIKTTKALDNSQRQEVFKSLQDKFALNDDALVSSEQFGPSVGQEIQNKAIIAIAIAAVGMLAYITVRFEVVFGVAAIIALMHDVLILISLYAIFYFPVNSPFIAAILTIVGYSINDTIVVFDRVREKMADRKKETHADIANKSVQSTLARSINTSLTTVVVISGLYIFGVESVKTFALPLIAGISAGTYSSIFIASPVWALWKDADDRKKGHYTVS